MSTRWGPAIALLLSVAGYGGMVVLHRMDGTLRAGNTPATIGLYLVAFSGFLVALLLSERGAIAPRLLWIAPVGFRVLLWFTDPTLSDDVYRYLWEGHVFSQGINPYSYAISAPELDGVEIALRALTNNQDLSSPYLPAAHFFFVAMAILGFDGPLGMQIVLTMFDLVAAALLYHLLGLAGLPGRRVLLYLWNPLVIVELAHGAHIDGFMVVLALVGVAATFGSFPSARYPKAVAPIRTALAPIGTALATLTRPLPLLLTPVLFWRWSWSQRAVYAAVLVGLVVPFGFGVGGWGLFGEPSGTGVFGSARVYSQEFRFNAVVSTWLERLTDSLGVDLSLVIGLLMAALVVAVWLLSGRSVGDSTIELRTSLRLLLVPLIGYVLLTPVLHPWYLILALALLVFQAPADDEPARRWVVVAPLLYLSAALSFSYLTYRNPEAFGELEWVRRVEWFPTLALGLVAVATLLTRTGQTGVGAAPDAVRRQQS